MLMTVTEAKTYFETADSDEVLKAKLEALELMIRAFTCNNFQMRSIRAVGVAHADGNKISVLNSIPFRTGDTIQVSESDFNAGLKTIVSSADGVLTVSEDLMNESGILITKVVYPMDVKLGAVNLLKWEESNRDKVGVKEETISRHSVTYFDMDSGNSVMGYPKSLLGFLLPYKKARFGRGIGNA